MTIIYRDLHLYLKAFDNLNFCVIFSGFCVRRRGFLSSLGSFFGRSFAVATSFAAQFLYL